MRKLTIIIMCIIAISFCATGCGNKEEEKINSNQLVQPPADSEEEENVKKQWKEISKDLQEDEDFNERINSIENSKEYTDYEKKQIIKNAIENEIIRKKYKKRLDELRKEAK